MLIPVLSSFLWVWWARVVNGRSFSSEIAYPVGDNTHGDNTHLYPFVAWSIYYTLNWIQSPFAFSYKTIKLRRMNAWQRSIDCYDVTVWQLSVCYIESNEIFYVWNCKTGIHTNEVELNIIIVLEHVTNTGAFFPFSRRSGWVVGWWWVQPNYINHCFFSILWKF